MLESLVLNHPPWFPIGPISWLLLLPLTRVLTHKNPSKQRKHFLKELNKTLRCLDDIPRRRQKVDHHDNQNQNQKNKRVIGGSVRVSVKEKWDKTERRAAVRPLEVRTWRKYTSVNCSPCISESWLSVWIERNWKSRLFSCVFQEIPPSHNQQIAQDWLHRGRTFRRLPSLNSKPHHHILVFYKPSW